MKILKLHVNNFGTLKDYDYSFNDGINEIIENNGNGKTTLTSFILAMFYGLETTRKGDVDFKDRVHYLPFSGGLFGGSIDIEVKNRKYHIERTFDSKSSTNDTYRFTDEFNRDIDIINYSSIGEYLFNVNKNSFISTIFIGANRVNIEMSLDISSKLNNLIDVSSSKNQYDKAITNIQNKIKDEEKNVTGIKNNINILDKENLVLDEILKNEASILEDYKNKNKELEDIENDLNVYLKNTELVTKYGEYKNIKDKQKELMFSIKELETKYNNNIPSIEEINRIKEQLDLMNKVQTITVFTPSETTEYNFLKSMFNNKEVLNETFIELNERVSKYNALTKEIENLNLKIDEKVKDKFDDSDITVEYIETELEPMANKYLELADSSSRHNKDKIKTLDKVFNIVSLVLCVVGFILVAFKYTIIGLVILALGIILFILNITLLLKRTNQINENERQEQATLEQTIKDVLKKYNYNTDHLKDNLKLLKDDLMIYEGYKSILSRINNNEGELSETKNEIIDLLKDTNVDFDAYLNNPYKFETDANTLKKYNTRLKEIGSIEENNISKKDEYLKTIKDILSKHNLEYSINMDEIINELTVDNIHLESYNKEFSKLSKEIYSLENEYDFSKVKDFDNSKVESLRNTERDIKKDLDLIKDKLDEIDKSRNKKEDNLLAINLNESKIEEINKDLRITKLVFDSLKKANSSLVERYIEPIKNRYSIYTSKLSTILSNSPTIDENLNVTFNSNGMNRNMKHLSSGEQTLLDLSLRLSLIDVMYKDEEPFIILDDPFIYLDSQKISLTKELISSLIENKQVIYLTCHESRSLLNE